MNSTNTDFKAIPIAADHDARNLAIVYGSLGTSIAFASLIFAILSWMRSRRRRIATHPASDDVELGETASPPRDTIRTREELRSPESISRGDPRQTTSTVPAIDITQS